jgi:hypothetical protein
VSETLEEFLGVPVVKKIYDWNRHCYTEVTSYSPGSRRTQPIVRVPARKPLTLANRLYFFLLWYGPQTARQLAQILMGNTKNKSLVRIVTELSKDKERFAVVGTREVKGMQRKLWGVNNGDKTIGHDRLGENANEQEPAQQEGA